MNKTTFTENLDKKQLIVSREFNGPLELVWRTWTEAELLDRWFAPKPYKSVTKTMDFKEGGHRLYCMQGPNGEEHWGIMNFKKIVVHDFFEAEDAFCDSEGNVNQDLPGTDWHVQFTKTSSGTKVEVTSTFASVETMKQLVEMGVKEGTAMSHDNLDELLKELQA